MLWLNHNEEGVCSNFIHLYPFKFGFKSFDVFESSGRYKQAMVRKRRNQKEIFTPKTEVGKIN